MYLAPTSFSLLSSSLLLLVVSLPLAYGEPNRSENDAIDEARFVVINGIEQWITIKSSDHHNPAILFVHGGPGNPLSVFSDSLYPNWDEQFTIIHWDQRYAGKTYQRNEPIEELTVERFNSIDLTVDKLVEDGLSVSAYLLQYLNKDKLILTGSSWGSVLAVHMAKQKPELYHAYVGLSQMVNYEENIAASYAKVLQRAEEAKDATALETLAQIGPPPWNNPRSFGQLRQIIRKYEQAATSSQPELIAAAFYDNESYWAAYRAGEELSFLKFVGLQNSGMASTIDLLPLGNDFEIPFYLVQGAEDLLTLPSISKSFFDQVEAPKKEYLLIPRSGHDPNHAMLEAQRELLEARILPQIEP